MSGCDGMELLELARGVMTNAYAPYSGFRVGAALVARSGEVYLGCNVENASYGLSICAERNALFGAIANAEQDFEAMAVVGDGERAPLPCGACRQVLAEFCGPEFIVYVANTADMADYQSYPLGELLPYVFEL